ncbi:hypothetical protein FRB99_000612 [Tulasnella sp. 403]|nr:hypothetical protein FRB99_000612 [Tulasnella sp. 403]
MSARIAYMAGEPSSSTSVPRSHYHQSFDTDHNPSRPRGVLRKQSHQHIRYKPDGIDSMDVTKAWVSQHAHSSRPTTAPTSPTCPPPMPPPSSSTGYHGSSDRRVRNIRTGGETTAHARRPSAQEMHDRLREPVTPSSRAFHGHDRRPSDHRARPSYESTASSSTVSTRNPSPQTPTSPHGTSLFGSYYVSSAPVNAVVEEEEELRPTPVAIKTPKLPLSSRVPTAFSTRPINPDVVASISSTPSYLSALGSYLGTSVETSMSELGLLGEDPLFGEKAAQARAEEKERERGRKKRGERVLSGSSNEGERVNSFERIRSTIRSKSLGRQRSPSRNREEDLVPRRRAPSPPPSVPPLRISKHIANTKPSQVSPTSIQHVDFFRSFGGDVPPSDRHSASFSDVSAGSSTMSAGGTRYHILNKSLRVVNGGEGSVGVGSSRSSRGSSIGSVIMTAILPNQAPVRQSERLSLLRAETMARANGRATSASSTSSPMASSPRTPSTPLSPSRNANTVLLPSPVIRSSTRDGLSSDVRRVVEALRYARYDEDEDVFEKFGKENVVEEEGVYLGLDKLIRATGRSGVPVKVDKALPAVPVRAYHLPRR